MLHSLHTVFQQRRCLQSSSQRSAEEPESVPKTLQFWHMSIDVAIRAWLFKGLVWLRVIPCAEEAFEERHGHLGESCLIRLFGVHGQTVGSIKLGLRGSQTCQKHNVPQLCVHSQLQVDMRLLRAQLLSNPDWNRRV